MKKLRKYQRHARAMEAEARALLETLYPMELEEAEQYLRDHRPSEGAIACLWIVATVSMAEGEIGRRKKSAILASEARRAIKGLDALYRKIRKIAARERAIQKHGYLKRTAAKVNRTPRQIANIMPRKTRK